MRTVALALGLSLLIGLSGLSSADAKAASVDALSGTNCALTTQLEINQCVFKQLEAADAALERVYDSLLTTLDPKGRAALRAAERAWISYKSATCAFVGLSRAGGSMQGQVINQCLIDLANEQAAKLSWQLKCGQQGEVLPRPGGTCTSP